MCCNIYNVENSTSEAATLNVSVSLLNLIWAGLNFIRMSNLIIELPVPSQVNKAKAD